jgi:hypothetical protein
LRPEISELSGCILFGLGLLPLRKCADTRISIHAIARQHIRCEVFKVLKMVKSERMLGQSFDIERFVCAL